MKNVLIVAAALIVAGCSSCPHPECQKAEAKKPVVYTAAPAPAPVVVERPACPCAKAKVAPAPQPKPCGCGQVAPAPCGCAQAAPAPCGCARPAPNREVQHPRIKQPVNAESPRRNCPNDGQTIDCGCGRHNTFQTKVSVVMQEVVPAMPEAYVLASNRVVSRFMKDAAPVYGKKPHMHLFVKPARALNPDLPGGVEKGSENFKKQIAASYTFEISENPAIADYYLDTTAEWFDTPSKSVPAILYKSVLYDAKNNKVKEWAEVIKKADNTQSWL